MPLYTAWRIDEKGVKNWLEGMVAGSDDEAWDKGRAMLDDWLKLRPRQKSTLMLENNLGAIFRNRPTTRPPEPELEPAMVPRHEEDDRWFRLDKDTPARFITGALTPTQKAAVLVELLRGLQTGSVVGCLDLAADENPAFLKLWLAQLELVVRNKKMAHDEIAARSILGKPRD